MNISQINNRKQMKPLKLSLSEMPHLTLEPSMMCNLNCRCCYNTDRRYSKSLRDVQQEVDFALSKRNLESISIVGGEPTLYPYLVELVSYIKSKNLICQFLTNGLLLASERGDALLDKLQQAGIDRIILHVDHGQGRSEKEMNDLCNTLFAKLEKRKIYFSLSVTIYQENKTILAQWLTKYASYKFFDGVLTTQTRNSNGLDDAVHPSPDLSELYDHVQCELAVEPASYIPSSIDDNEVCWLMFFYYINTNTHQTFSISPLFNRFFRTIYRWFLGHHVFAITMNPKYFACSFLITSLVEIFLKPWRIFSLIQLLKNSNWLHALRFQYILMQSGPQYNQVHKQFSLCYHCPDATVRNGKITPVCLANHINPLGSKSQIEQENQKLYTLVYEHMQEL
jgi:hypothetical protein